MLKSVRYFAMMVSLVVLAAVPAAAEQTGEPASGTSSFNIFFRSTLTGVERVTLTNSTDGWTISSSGQLSAPFVLSNRSLEVEYDLDWRPRRLMMDGSRQGRDFSIQTSFADGIATNNVIDAGRSEDGAEPYDPASVVLPDYFFGSYEALAVRLASATEGDRVPVYVAPRGPTDAVVREIVLQQLETADRALTVRVYRISFENPERTLEAEVWVDDRQRLLRVTLPTVQLDVVRQDLSLVSTRLSGVQVPGDSAVRVPVVGFSLAATVTAPVTSDAPEAGRPAVILVPGTRSNDRDEHLFGVPIFGQLAGVLSGDGYLVVRYDKRGVGQSGGRQESATIEDYADDVRAMVRYVRERDDVDEERVVVVAHGEGGWIGLQAAARDDGIAALVLLATPSVDGATLLLEQQQMEFERVNMPDRERAENTALQRRIHDAILGDGTWDTVPDEIRRQSDTLWFRSFLEFEPAQALERADQPILIIHGLLDQQIPSHHADRLGELAQRRGRDETVEVVKLDDLNHLMLMSQSGSVAEYASLSDATVAMEMTATLLRWIDRVIPPTP